MQLSSAIKLLLAVFILASLALAQGVTDQTAPSLGQVAREQKNANASRASKVYTNEDLPTSGGVSVVGESAESAPPTEEVTNQNELDRRWHRVLAAQKAHIADLQHQLAVAEQKQRRSAHRYPIGANPRYEKWGEAVETLKQQVEDAKQQLADLQEQAHKAGVNQAYD